MFRMIATYGFAPVGQSIGRPLDRGAGTFRCRQRRRTSELRLLFVENRRGLAVRFLRLNALQLSSLGEQFDTVLDCGLFHVFEDDERPKFVTELADSVTVGGRYYMLCFSDRQPSD